MGFFSSCREGGYFPVEVHRLVVVAPLFVDHGLSSCSAGLGSCYHELQITGSVDVAHGLSCSSACGIFPDQGLNPSLLHWQADSFTAEGSPNLSFSLTDVLLFDYFKK